MWLQAYMIVGDHDVVRPPQFTHHKGNHRQPNNRHTPGRRAVQPLISRAARCRTTPHTITGAVFACMAWVHLHTRTRHVVACVIAACGRAPAFCCVVALLLCCCSLSAFSGRLELELELELEL